MQCNTVSTIKVALVTRQNMSSKETQDKTGQTICIIHGPAHPQGDPSTVHHLCIYRSRAPTGGPLLGVCHP